MHIYIRILLELGCLCIKSEYKNTWSLGIINNFINTQSVLFLLIPSLYPKVYYKILCNILILNLYMLGILYNHFSKLVTLAINLSLVYSLYLKKMDESLINF